MRFLPRDTGSFTIKETWDVLGMRATRSDDTVLDGAFVPDEYIARVVPMGFAGADLFVLAIFAWALIGFGNVYYGLARRVLRAHDRSGQVAELACADPFDGVSPRSPARRRRNGRWSSKRSARSSRPSPATGPTGCSTPDWPIKIVAAKYRAVEGAWRIVDRAMDVSGGFGMFKKSELERLFRDARAGRFHPANSALSHEVVGKLALGNQSGRNAPMGRDHSRQSAVGSRQSAVGSRQSAVGSRQSAVGSQQSAVGSRQSQSVMTVKRRAPKLPSCRN